MHNAKLYYWQRVHTAGGGLKRRYEANGTQGICTGAEDRARERHYGDDGDDDELSKKRPRVGSAGYRQKVPKLPCVFLVGEPNNFPGHNKKFQHISDVTYGDDSHLQSRRFTNRCCRTHLKRSHGIFACPKCFTKFHDASACDSHGGTRCVKACSKRACQRYRLYGTTPLTECECLMNAEQRWHEVFALVYQLRAIANALSDSAPFGSFTLTTLSSSMQGEPAGNQNPQQQVLGNAQMDSVDAMFANIDWDVEENPMLLEHSMAVVGPDAALQPNVSTLDMHEELQRLRLQVSCLQEQLQQQKEQQQQEPADRAVLQNLQQQVALLEQRQAEPSRELRTAEATLRMLWEAFQSTGDARAQPESTLYGRVSSVLTPAAIQPVIQSQTPSCIPVVNVQSRPVITAGQMEVPPPADNVMDPSTLVRLGKQPDRDAYYADSGYITTYRTSQ